MLLASRRDPQLGPMVAVGLGGLDVEANADVALGLAPVSPDGARSMVASLRGAAVLGGSRGRPAADVAALGDAIVRVSQLAAALPSGVQTSETNPLLVLPGPEVGLTSPSASDAGNKWPNNAMVRRMITRSATTMGSSTVDNDVIGVGLRDTASSSTSTSVCMAIPPGRFPVASPRLPLAAAETVMAIAGNVPAKPRRIRPLAEVEPVVQSVGGVCKDQPCHPGGEGCEKKNRNYCACRELCHRYWQARAVGADCILHDGRRRANQGARCAEFGERAAAELRAYTPMPTAVPKGMAAWWLERPARMIELAGLMFKTNQLEGPEGWSGPQSQSQLHVRITRWRTPLPGHGTVFGPRSGRAARRPPSCASSPSLYRKACGTTENSP